MTAKTLSVKVEVAGMDRRKEMILNKLFKFWLYFWKSFATHKQGFKIEIPFLCLFLL